MAQAIHALLNNDGVPTNHGLDGIQSDLPFHEAVLEGKYRKCPTSLDADLHYKPCPKVQKSTPQKLMVALLGPSLAGSLPCFQMVHRNDAHDEMHLGFSFGSAC